MREGGRGKKRAGGGQHPWPEEMRVDGGEGADTGVTTHGACRTPVPPFEYFLAASPARPLRPTQLLPPRPQLPPPSKLHIQARTMWP